MIASLDSGDNLIVTYGQSSSAISQGHFVVARRSRDAVLAGNHQYALSRAGPDGVCGGGYSARTRPQSVGYVHGTDIPPHIKGGSQYTGAQPLLIGSGCGGKKEAIDCLWVCAC